MAVSDRRATETLCEVIMVIEYINMNKRAQILGSAVQASAQEEQRL